MIKLFDLLKEAYNELKVGDKVRIDSSVASTKYGVDPKTIFKITALQAGNPEVPSPNTHATLRDNAGKEIKKVYTGYLKKDQVTEGEGESKSPKNISIAQIVGPDHALAKKPEHQWSPGEKKLYDDIMDQYAKNGKAPKLKENQDHEVSMAQASLKSIISSASQLMNKLGNMERNIPGWIQDHITNAENYIDQAAQGFHELNDNE